MASSASTEQCILAGGSPPNASATALLVSFKASSMVFPLIISVEILLVAIAAPQPKVLNFTYTIRIGKFSYITRVCKMIHDFWTVLHIKLLYLKIFPLTLFLILLKMVIRVYQLWCMSYKTDRLRLSGYKLPPLFPQELLFHFF